MEAEISSHRDASDMLEDALQQFDNIISSSPTEITVSEEFVSNGLQGISQLMDDLRITIQAEQISGEDDEKLLSLLSPETLQFYRDLFKLRAGENEAKNLQKLKNENDSLALQVSVLSDQVELQMEKMEELIVTNKDLQNKLLSTEELLQKEICTNTDRERKMIALKEQVRILQSRDVRTEKVQHQEDSSAGSRKVANTPSGFLKKGTELISPDEGIVHDKDDVDGPENFRLKMPEPSATSTPISAIPSNIMKMESQNTKILPDSQNSTPKKAPNEQYKSVSLERLHGKKIITEGDLQKVKKSSSQSDDWNVPKDDVSITKTKPMQTNSKSSSSPNLAMTEIESDPVEELGSNRGHDESVEASPFQSRKKHSFKKFFSSFRLRRSNSSSLQSSEVASLQSWGGKTGKNPAVKVSGNPDSFSRGGLRATAGPRLGWTKPKTRSTNTKPFAQWSTDEVTEWMGELGLEAYVENCKLYVKSGATLLQATNQDIEKELGIHNPLHKKKLMLSLQALGEEDEVGGQMIKGQGMDHVTVARWLDDIGLPQYKDSFHKARIDCRMLHHLTIGDLQRLRITNLLHTLSFRRAIYTLRKINFDVMQLKRRPVNVTGEKEQVSLWTNHRVMEWLRSIDLAEYAPNLRGSGVHGSLMIYEPQFTGEILASLLHIPSSKSLLRRHLVAQFNYILPAEQLTLKQKEASLTALNIMAKVKIGRRSFGPLSRLRGFGGSSYREFSNSEYVCPFETKNSAAPHSLESHRRNLGTKMQMQESKKQHTWDADEQDVGGDSASDDSSNIKIVELDESATKKIGAFSAELATMTNKWSED